MFAYTLANERPHELNAPFSLSRFTTGNLIDEHGRRGGGALSPQDGSANCC